MDLKVPQKQFEELVRKATTLDTIEKFVRDLTAIQRNNFAAGELADLLLELIENTRRQCE